MALKITDQLHIDTLYTVFLKEFTLDYKFHGEVHKFWELVCVLEGSASVTADSNVFTLSKGQAFLHPPMQFHNFSSLDSKALTLAVFTFSGSNIPDITGRVCQIPDISSVRALYELARRSFDFGVDVWIKKAKADNSNPTQFIKHLELLLLSLISSSSQDDITPSQGALNYSIIAKTLQDNIHHRLNVKHIAKLCNMSEINLQKTFSKYAGVGVMEYFNRIRMHYATSLLESGSTVKEAALTLGYTDQNYFSTVYKRITGHTPSQMQKKTQASL